MNEEDNLEDLDAEGSDSIVGGFTHKPAPPSEKKKTGKAPQASAKARSVASHKARFLRKASHSPKKKLGK